MLQKITLIAQVMRISGSDKNEAKFYLASSRWSLEVALFNFLGNQEDNDNDMRGETTSRDAVMAVLLL